MKKTTTTILVAMLAVGLVGFTVALSQDVTAQNSGQNTIRTEPPTFDTPDVQRMTEIAQQLHNENITDAERTALVEEAQQIKSSYEQGIDNTARQAVLDKRDLVAGYITSNLASKSFGNFTAEFPVSGLYVDTSNNLVVNVFPDKLAEHSAGVLSKVRELVGNDVSIIVQPMAAITSQCSQTGDCEPAQGGVKISTLHGACSVGFKAQRNGETGFVTAGHCTGGNTNETVGQPNYFYWDHIGTVTTNSYSAGSTADALFVNADENISDRIYNNLDVNVAGYTALFDGVHMEGHATRGVSGVVVIASYSNYVDGVWINDMAATNYAGQDGDSGAPVYSYVPSKNFKGTHVGYNGIVSAYSKQANILDEIPGLSWDFT